MLRVVSLLAALLLLAYLLWSPAETDLPLETTEAPPEVIEQAPPLAGNSPPPPVAREEVVEDPGFEEFEIYEEADPEPVGHGDCTLDLRVFDAHTSQPVASSVQLWRLDVPATDTWTMGDQLQVSSEDPQGVFRFSNLPEGDYRIYALSARLGAESPPAFRVEGEITSVERFIDMPRERHAVLHLYRPDGYPLIPSGTQRLEMRDRGTGYSMHLDPVPEWAQRRFPKGPYALVSESIGGGFSSSSHRRWKLLLPFGEGIPLGLLKENDRSKKIDIKREFRLQGGLSVTVHVQPQGYPAYAAVFLDPAEVQEHLIFPDGSIPQDFSEDFVITAEAVPLGLRDGLPGGRPQVSAANWWDVEVRV